MREIKFRGWDMASKEMLYDYCYLNKGNKFNCYTSTDNIRIIESVMQYTGFKDCLEKDIYEGDIVIIYFNNNKSKCNMKLIEYIKGMFCTQNYKNTNYHSLERHNKDLIIDNILVVGNIYENLTMLKANYDRILNFDACLASQYTIAKG
jgi:uncharacterized phage protein (TIGR01671 family)